METQYLRIMLLIIGGLVIAAIVWDGLRRKKKLRIKQAPEVGNLDMPEQGFDDPLVGDVTIEPISFDEKPEPTIKQGHEAAEGEQIETPTSETKATVTKQQTLDLEPQSEVKEDKEQDVAFAEDIVVLNIIGKNRRQFVGYELLQAILSNGFRFGQRDLFHRHKELNGQGPVLFSLASTTADGTFDMKNIGAFSCAGLTLFLELPAPKDGMAVFDLMLNNARGLADSLKAELVDEKFQPLTDTGIERYKTRIRKFERGQMALDLISD